MKILLLVLTPLALFGALCSPVGAESVFPSPSLQKLKTPPKKFSEAPDVITEWVEAANVCEAEKICVDGVVYNRGRKPAYNVRLLVEIGGGTHSKPRTSFYQKLENAMMNPEDRQDFSFTIDRKIPYKEKGKDKEVEVGKYNFRVTPVWTDENVIINTRSPRKK
jgi:hypothetical protein